jgi:integrase
MQHKKVKQLAINIASKRLSGRSAKDYANAFAMLDEVGLTPQEYAESCAQNSARISKSRYYVLKGAYQHGLASRIAKNLVELQELNRHDQTAADDQIAHLKHSVHRDCEKLAEQKADYSRTRYRNNLDAAHEVPFDPKPRKGKRQSLGRLNRAYPDWQERIYTAIAKQHRPLVATLAVTGCRPDEFSKEIQLRIAKGQLIAIINGSKTNSGYGQKIRTMIFRPSTPMEKTLFTITEQIGGTVELGPTASQRAIREAFRRAVIKSLGKAWADKVSQYSFRQQFAADLKKTRLDKQLIALALGHCSDMTQGHYGLARQGQKSYRRGLRQVEGTQPVKSRASKPVESP